MVAAADVKFSCVFEDEDGEQTRFDVPAGKHVLGALSAKGLMVVPVGCRGGGCGVCRVRVVEGDYECLPMSRRHVSAEAQAEGVALACRLVPRSNLVLKAAPREAREVKATTRRRRSSRLAPRHGSA